MLVEPPSTSWDLRWRMLGMQTRVHPLFWLVALLLGWSGVKGDLRLLLLWVACVLVSVLVHELGHALVARAVGAHDTRIVLYAMGGLTIHGGTGSHARWHRVVELLMGPGAQLLVFAGPLYLALVLGAFPESTPELVIVAVAYLLAINVIWAVVNLLPVYPLDGGQIVHTLVDAGRNRSRAQIVHKVSIAAALLIAVGAVAGELTGLFPYGGWWTGLLFGLLAFDNWRMLQMARTPAWMMADDPPREPWEQDPDWWKRGR